MKIQVMSYRPIRYDGLFHEEISFPYEVTILVKDWWGMRIRTKNVRIWVPIAIDVQKWFDIRKDKWISWQEFKGARVAG